MNTLKGVDSTVMRNIGIRCFSNSAIFRNNVEISSIRSTLPSKRIYFYALPITNKKTFLHCKYNNDIFPNGKKTLEGKIIDKATSVWSNFSKSQSKINQKVVRSINRILSKIPWLESCLLSIPSQRFITRKLKEDKDLRIENSNKYVTHDEILEKNIKGSQLEKFDYYYPKELTNMGLMLQNFKPEFKNQYEMHRKGIWRELLLLPLTIPFALVPLLPNIPGFYLLYRIYCHIKVIASLKFLVLLLKDGHLDYHKVEGITEIYLSSNDAQVRANVINEIDRVSKLQEFAEKDLGETDPNEEKLLISEDVAQELCKAFNDEECTEKLIFAIQQERKHLEEQKATKESE
ncbi:hypothetical protein CAS74_002546 [Pichia kudriavzevii]|uniref:Uncharacterized protein n=1 Tax=Pichia kudriavzevii TaxID=4909 RepID=A0A099NZ99_PICKU|nr:uncharacterized protein C5L36_0D05660 [Pichia kudriavzevii]AWU77840.1 hypothetical protein C5L36_0D05660 [Pichia kudriavzevii]KGK37915.1 hypothetical protein JL09_g2907 [Pichia kudriavzevii]OUT22801.1 hypothetical protein CAS74_002546 [Pichia kudriavzevii]